MGPRMKRPLPVSVSVIIPTYNRAAMLREAIESVRQQTVKDVEVLVVDDGSTDETPRVVQEFGDFVTYLRQDNGGVAAARNRGIQAAHGHYIAFLDSDDLWLPHKLERQIDYLRDHPEIGLLYARMWSYDVEKPSERRLDPYVVATNFTELLNGPNAVTTSTVVVRRECLETVGVFNPAIRAAEDHELWLRIARRFAIGFLDEPLAEYRRHSKSINNDLTSLYEGYRVLYEIILQRYRQELRNPRAAERQLAKFEYLCGTSALKRGEARRAARLIRTSLTRDRRLGTQFLKANASFSQRVWLPLKPYAALVVSTLNALKCN